MLFATTAQSGIILKSFTETPTTLSVEWGWDPEQTDTYGMYGTHWWTYLKIVEEQEEWRVHWEFTHLTAPHAGDVAPAPQFGGDASFRKGDLGVVISQYGDWPHPQEHRDRWSFAFNRSAGPPNTSITLEVSHFVPEPAALLLFGTGLGAVLGFGRRRRKA